MAVLVRNGTLVDGTERDPVVRGAVLVEGTRIVEVGTEDSVHAPADAQVIDAEGGTIIPGLFNLHDHVSRKSLRVPPPGISFRDLGAKLRGEPEYYRILHSAHNVLGQLRSGVTTIVDISGAGGGYTAIALRRGINEGLVPGPRMLAAGYGICMTGGHGHMHNRVADGPDEVRKAVREQVKAGADLIKLMGSGGLNHYPDEDPETVEYTFEEMKAGVEEAHKFRKLAAVHAYGNEAVKIALRAGIDRIEHGAFVRDEDIEVMRRADVAYVPTVSGLVHLPFQHRVLGRHDLYDAIMEGIISPQMQSIRRAVEAGLRVGTGTDSAGEVVEELEIIQEASGMSNLDCIRAATRVSAGIARLSNVTGTLEAGKCADVVVVDGQPLERIGDLRKPRWVIRNGQLFDGAPMPLSLRVRTLRGTSPTA